MDHLTRILRDMTNSIEQLGMQWKEKSLTIVAGLRRLVEGMEARGSWLDSRGWSEASFLHRISKGNSLFFAKKALLCDPKVPVKRRIHAFHSTCVAAVLHGSW